jgi:hypothetical protein
MIPPGLSQAVGAEVASQSNLPANSRNELPGLPTSNRYSEIIGFGVEEKKILGIADNIGISRKKLSECFSNIGIDRDLVAFAAFLLFELETLSDRLPIIYEMTNP